MTTRIRGTVGRIAAAATVLLTVALAPAPASAAEGNIDHVETDNGKVQILYSLSGAGETAPDLKSLAVKLDGKPLTASAELASEAAQTLRRTTILAIDVSESMAGDKFTEAKRAARIFLDSAPADLYVGIVTFAGGVQIAQEPSLDRKAAAQVVDDLQLSRGTLLYPGINEAVSLGGKQGQRSIIVLSDGRDTSDVKLSSVTAAIEKADIKVDVVALAQSSGDEALLQPLSDAGNGSIISASDPKALGQVFTKEAQTLARQILVTAEAPPGDKREGTLEVSVAAAGQSYSDSAFVTLSSNDAESSAKAASKHLIAAPSTFTMTSNMMLAGILSLGVGILVILIVLLGGLGKKPTTVEAAIAPYTRRGGKRADKSPTHQGMAAQAVDLATKALNSNRGFETKLADKLEAGGLALKPPEWLLIHAGVAVSAAALSFMLTGGDPVFTAVALLLGLLLPWVYLGHKASRRLKAFNSQLAPTLQLMAGSLQAGLSLAQGLDTIVREGAEPVAGEFRRVLVETRLGVTIEDALESVAERMASADFKWTIMAIRIQREVGGNLAELLLNVAGTLRERDYLRRQVKSLSAEGRFSAYILLLLPPGILLYEFATNRGYVQPLVSTSIGLLMLGAMAAMMGIGGFMMKRMIKLEV